MQQYYYIIILIIILVIIYLIQYNTLNDKQKLLSLDKFEVTPKDHNDIKHLLKILKIILDANNITYWIMSGTLLGSVRHNDIIPWDDDADIGIKESDLDKLLSLNSELNKMGFEIVKHWKLYKFRFINNTYPFIDIFCYKKDPSDNNKWIFNDSELIKTWPNEYFYNDELFPLKLYNFDNEYYTGPNFPLTYLDRMYWLWEFYAMKGADHKDHELLDKSKFNLDVSNPEHKLKPLLYPKSTDNIQDFFNDNYQNYLIVQHVNNKNKTL